jgi:HEAT repeat protein
VGGEQALELLENVLTDQNSYVRYTAGSALAEVGGEKARDILLKRLPEEKDQEVLSRLSTSLRRCYAGDPAVEKALKEAWAKLPKE